MINIEETRQLLELLGTSGVRRARFEGQALAEVEFFDAGTRPGDELGETGEEAATTDETAPYLRALKQIRTRRFAEAGEES